VKLLFIQHGSRIRKSETGKYYVDGNFNNDIWKRYKSYCDELTIILRMIPEDFDEEYLQSKFNYVDTNLVNLITVDDVYSPKSNYINPKIRKRIKETIEEQVKNCDKVILRSAGDFYTDIAYRCCKKHNKPFLVEAIGFPFECFWYHSMFGKVIAFPIDRKFKKTIANAPYTLYVTNEALQKRYPCRGEILGCSDVEINIDNKNKSIVDNRKNKLNMQNNKIILGTIGNIDAKLKAQKDVIKSLYKLKQQGYNNFEYQLVGGGDGNFLNRLIKKYNLQHNVKILGELPHSKVYNWLEKIDIYIHPSHNEGLCRSIIEAMSRGCAVICADVGGNYELVEKKYLYKKGNIKELTKLLKKIKKEDIIEQSKINYEKAKRYDAKVLNKKRDEFYLKFTKKEVK